MKLKLEIDEWLGDEESAFREAAMIGEQHGYGNLIAHLMREWQIHLMRAGLNEKTARRAVIIRAPYSLTFHRPSGLPPISAKR